LKTQHLQRRADQEKHEEDADDRLRLRILENPSVPTQREARPKDERRSAASAAASTMSSTMPRMCGLPKPPCWKMPKPVTQAMTVPQKNVAPERVRVEISL
jgi:hypothetical protein